MDEQITNKAQENKPNTALLCVIAGIVGVAVLGTLLAQDGTPNNAQVEEASNVPAQTAKEAGQSASKSAAQGALVTKVQDFSNEDIDWSQPVSDIPYVEVRMRTNAVFYKSLPFSISQSQSSGMGWCSEEVWTFYMKGKQLKAKWEAAQSPKSITYDASYAAIELNLTNGVNQDGRRVRNPETGSILLSADPDTIARYEEAGEVGGWEMEANGKSEAMVSCRNSNAG